jgi:hypothetical protein
MRPDRFAHRLADLDERAASLRAQLALSPLDARAQTRILGELEAAIEALRVAEGELRLREEAPGAAGGGLEAERRDDPERGPSEALGESDERFHLLDHLRQRALVRLCRPDPGAECSRLGAVRAAP